MTQLRTHSAALTVREIDPNDPAAIEAFLDIVEEYFRENWPKELDRPQWRERYRDLLLARCKTDPKRWLWIILQDGEVVGMTIFYLTGASSDRLGNIAEFYVRARLRGRRIGRQIYDLAREAMRNAGATRINASVQVDELGRVKFWESLGFRVERLHMVADFEDPTP